MLHVSYADYQSVYKGTLTESDYGCVVDEACAYVDKITYQRLEEDIPDYVKKAVCAVADVIFSKNKLLKDSKFQSRVNLLIMTDILKRMIHILRFRGLLKKRFTTLQQFIFLFRIP